MQNFILVLVMLVFPLTTISAAENYSCRDDKGRLHVADNLMNLPEECRYQAETSNPDDPGKVNFVPPAAQTQQDNNSFDSAVNQAEQEIRQRKREAEALIQQTENLVNSYENAVITRKTAVGSKSYGSREIIILSTQEMERARRNKQTLLIELSQAHLTSTQREEIEALLDRIQD